jgi:hypothetical protein
MINLGQVTTLPEVTENHSEYGVTVGKIVRRILEYAPPKSIEGLNQVIILDRDPKGRGFARYLETERVIELYLDAVIGWQPWVLRKSYFFPYLAISLALGHEIDHHVNRGKREPNEERSAEKNVLKYTYPSFGVFKPLVRLFAFLFKRLNILRS